MTIRPSTCHGDSTPNVTAGYLESSTALLRHRNIFDIGTLGSAHDGLLLILPSHDYVFLEKARFLQSDARNFARSETRHITSGSTAHRSSAAAGVSLLDSGHSFCAFTNVTREVLTRCALPTPSASRIVAVYADRDDKAKQALHGYRLVKVKRLDTAEKRSEANASLSYRKILIGEGLTCVCALLCTKKVCVTPDVERCDFGRLKLRLHANCHSSWTDVVLKWMTGTGEMRNHEAMACHTDGNYSHADEILTLFNQHGQTGKK